MRYIRCMFTILLLLTILTNEGVKVSAVNTASSTESMPENEMTSFLKNTIVPTLNTEPERKPIDCFDINENGVIAIGSSDFENKTICIYSNNGQFLFGYRFKCNGEFGVEFAKNDLVIYFVRSNVAMAVNHMGEVVEIQEIQNTPENNSYWNNHVLSNSRKIGDTEYSLKNNFGILNVFASSYSQLIVREANGEERILYDVNSAQLFNMLFMFICVLLTVCLAVAVLVRQFVKLKHVM